MNKKGFKQRIDEFFKISANGSSFKVEIIAGIATFLAMSYILTVNPDQILYAGSADPRWPSLFIATALFMLNLIPLAHIHISAIINFLASNNLKSSKV